MPPFTFPIYNYFYNIFTHLNIHPWGKTDSQITTARPIPPTTLAIATGSCPSTRPNFPLWGWFSHLSPAWPNPTSSRTNSIWATSSVYKSHSPHKNTSSPWMKARINPTRKFNFQSFPKTNKLPKSTTLYYSSNMIDFLVATINIEEDRIQRVR